jgi:hypothetical protein
MSTALSSYAPNIPWAVRDCSNTVRLNGGGTSAATPQIAAAAALYVQRYRDELLAYPQPWMRVEAVRRALFATADKSGDQKMLGNGALRAARALDQAPPAATDLQQTPADTASFSFLRAITGLGVASSRDDMFVLEATQLSHVWTADGTESPLTRAMQDPDLPAEKIPESEKRAYLEGLIDHPHASPQLKAWAESVRATQFGGGGPNGGGGPKTDPGDKVPPPPPPIVAAAAAPPVKVKPFAPPTPPFRGLRGYAIDPGLAVDPTLASVSQMEFKVPWEPLDPGPVGEYLEVIDIDPGSACDYEPVDLNDPHLLAQNGLPPSEGSPQFHQQTVYAVSSLTIRNFERALGRRILWSSGPSPDPAYPEDDSRFVRRLRIHPHALRERNAYYSPNKVALLFGYFNAVDDNQADYVPGSMVFTCLSHDVIAHETTHALLDGMYRRYLNPSNPDVRAFHEGFADIVALFQHFTFPEILHQQIASTRGEIRTHENLLGQLARQFAQSAGFGRALRDAIGETKDGVWVQHRADPKLYDTVMEVHARGAILVEAVFAAFLTIYDRRTADLLRLATGGTGVLRPGAIHPDLALRLANEAATAAQHVLTMCIRALDYCPPTDLTFGEYLRAIISADVDVVPNDDLQYRVAFIDAFRERGLYPRDVRALSEESLLWQNAEVESSGPSNRLLQGLSSLRHYAEAYLFAESLGDSQQPRETLFQLQRNMRRDIHKWLEWHFDAVIEGRDDAEYLGIDPTKTFQVHTARFAFRTTADRGVIPQIVVSLLQKRDEPVDLSQPDGPTTLFEGGCTIVSDLRSQTVRYCIRKRSSSATRLDRQRQFALGGLDSYRSTYFGLGSAVVDEPFAVIHRGS